MMGGGGFGGGQAVEQRGTAINSHDISVTALYYSLDNFVIPEVTQEHPEWSFDQIREEAVHRMEIRSADNIKKGYDPELDRQEVMTTEWEIVETESGKQMASWNGDRYQTRKELWNNFESYAKSQGEWTESLEREKNAQLEMETAVIKGNAKAAATWLSHESNQARLLQVWEKSDDGHVITKQYDMGRIAGRDLTQLEAEQVMHHIGKLYGEKTKQTSEAYPHLIAKETIRIADVAVIAREQIVFNHVIEQTRGVDATPQIRVLPSYEDVIRPREVSVQDLVTGQTADTIERVTYKVLRDTRETVGNVSRFLRDRGKVVTASRDSVLPIPVIERVRRLFADRLSRKKGKKAEAERAENTEHTGVSVIIRSERAVIRSWSKESGKKIRKEMEKEHKKRVEVAQTIGFIQETGVGLGAVPFLLQILVKEPQRSVASMEKSIARHTKKEKRKKQKVKMIHRRMLRQAKERGNNITLTALSRFTELKLPQIRESILKKKKRKKTLGVVSVEYKTKRKRKDAMIRKMIGKVLRRIPKEEQDRLMTLPKKERRLWVLLAVIALQRANLQKIVERRKQRKKNMMQDNDRKAPIFQSDQLVQDSPIELPVLTRESSETTLAFSFAWILILLVNARKITVRPSFSAKSSVYSHVSIHESAEETRSNGREVTPWILLSIIWYLAQIREQGHSNNPIKKKRKNRQKRLKRLFSRAGVIFAYPRHVGSSFVVQLRGNYGQSARPCYAGE